MRNQDRQAGIGLLELMLSSVIISVLMLSILSYYRASQGSQKINQAVQMLGYLLIACEDWLSTYHSFTPNNVGGKNFTINIRSLVEQGKLPSNFCSHSDCTENVANPWAGSVVLYAKDSNHVEMILSGLPKQSSGKAICQQIHSLLKHKVSSDYSNALQGECRLTYSGT